MSKKHAEKEEELDKSVEDTTKEVSDETETNELSKEEQLQEEIKQLNDKHLRLYSEFENFRRRTAKEKLELINTASEKVMLELIPILDDFKRAKQNNADSTDIEAIKNGINLIYEKMQKTLTNAGLKKMDAQGDIFDADKHEAVTNIPAPSKDMKGKVVDVIEEGYYLNDKIIRFAKVVVGE